MALITFYLAIFIKKKDPMTLAVVWNLDVASTSL